MAISTTQKAHSGFRRGGTVFVSAAVLFSLVACGGVFDGGSDHAGISEGAVQELAAGQVDTVTDAPADGGSSDVDVKDAAPADEGRTPSPSPAPSAQPSPPPAAQTPPPAAQTPAPAPAAQSIYKVQTLVDDAFTPNDNGWYLNMNGDLTADRNGPTTNGVQHYAFVAMGLRQADAKSHWPKRYLDSEGFAGNTRIRYLAWNVLMDAAQAGNTAGNTRVQFRNAKIHVLYKNGTWETVASDPLNASPNQWGGWYAHFNGNPGTEPTRATTGGGALHEGRSEPASNGGGSSLGSMGYATYENWAFHGWPLAFTRNQSELVNNVEGVVFVYEARLTLHDPNGTDDRSRANIMAWTGADWYNDSNGGSYISEYNHSKVKLVRNHWQIFATHDLSPSVLRANPPPGFSN